MELINRYWLIQTGLRLNFDGLHNHCEDGIKNHSNKFKPVPPSKGDGQWAFPCRATWKRPRLFLSGAWRWEGTYPGNYLDWSPINSPCLWYLQHPPCYKSPVPFSHSGTTSGTQWSSSWFLSWDSPSRKCWGREQRSRCSFPFLPAKWTLRRSWFPSLSGWWSPGIPHNRNYGSHLHR